MPDDAPVSAFVSRRYWRFLGAACVLLAAALGWLGSSESGFRFLCANLTKITAGRLQIEAPDGRLLGDWQAKSVRWHGATDELELQHFRNYSGQRVSFDPDCNVIFGENAQGKTNLLEALWLFTGGHSFRGAKDVELPRLVASLGAETLAAALSQIVVDSGLQAWAPAHDSLPGQGNATSARLGVSSLA